jgi:hypothetical protein
MKVVFLAILFYALIFAKAISHNAEVSQYPELTGATLMNRGLDFYAGGQVPEEKLRSPIFKYTYDGKVYTPAGRPDLTFKVPKEITVTPMATHLEQTNSSLYYSYEHTVSVDIRRFSFSLGLNLGKFGFGAQYGYEYGRIKERLNVKYQASARALYLTTTYSTIALPYLFMPKDEVFEMVLQQLPPTPRTPQDLTMYKMTLDYYGGWFLWQAVFGGQIRYFSFLTQEITQNKDIKWIQHQLSLSFYYNMFNLTAGGFRRKEDIKMEDVFRQNHAGEIVFTGGFRRLQTNTTMKQWDRSIDDAPGLLEGKFRPLSDLIADDPVKKANFEWIIKTYSETGQVLSPPSSILVHSYPKIPGYQIAGSGFCASHLQTRLPIFVHDDEGFKQHTTWTNPFHKHLTFAVPSTVVVKPRLETTEWNLTDVSMSKFEYEVTYSKKYTSRYAFGFGKRSTSIYFYQYRYEYRQEYKIYSAKQISWYDVLLSPSLLFDPQMQDKYMHPHLKEIINRLETDYSKPSVKEMYRMLIDYFGTHLVTGAMMGGELEQDVYFNKDLLKSVTIDQVIRQSSLSLAGFLKAKKYNFRKDGNLDEWYREHVEASARFKGGRYVPSSESKNTPWEDFVASIRTDPGVLKYEIVPISILVRDPIKKANLDRAIEEYLKEMSVDV